MKNGGVDNDVRLLLAAGEIIKAIKLHRSRTGLDLRTAKAEVDEARALMGSADAAAKIEAQIRFDERAKVKAAYQRLAMRALEEHQGLCGPDHALAFALKLIAEGDIAP